MKRPNNLTMPGGFRLIRAFSVVHNANRLRHYVDDLRSRPEARRWMARLRLHRRFSTRRNPGSGDV